MVNNTNMTATLSADLVRASIILPMMDECVLIIVYICGIIGSLLNVFTLLQKQFRRNPCSLYFLSASITDFFIMNLVVLMDLMRYFNPKLFNYISTTTIWCQLGKYFIYFLSCLSSSYICLACIDRFCTSSHREKLRSLSRIKVSRILIPLSLIIWILFPLHMFATFDIIGSNPTNSYQCTNAPNLYTFYLVIDGYFFAMFNGLIVPIFLGSFGILIHRNVQQSRRRTAPSQSTNSVANLPLNRYNLHLITILLVQSVVTIFLNIPYMVIYLNDVYNNVPTNQLFLLIFAIFTYLARWFWFSNYAKTFYINTLSSLIYRKTLKQQLINLMHRFRNRIMPQIS